jgi:phage terminase large subunit
MLRLQAAAELELRKREQTHGGRQRFDRYQTDPRGFCEDFFQEHYTDDVIRVMESVLTNQVTIARSANAIGKSHGAARVAIWFYKVFPDAKVFTTAAPPEKNLRQVLWGQIYSLTSRRPELFVGDKVNADMYIARDSESFITGVAIPSSGTPEQREAKFSGKHAPHLLFIVDEGDAVPPEVYRAIESCMSGGMARLLIMFNPRAEVGPVANMIRSRNGNVVNMSAFSHPNVIEGKDIFPGAITREKTVWRINEWTRPLAPSENPNMECFKLPDYLVGAVAARADGTTYMPLPAGFRRVMEPSFFYMTLGLYPPQAENQLISQVWLDNAVSRWLAYVAQYGETPPKGVTPRVGFDVADMGKDMNQLCKRYGGWVAPLIGWQGVDADMSAIKAAEYLAPLAANPANIAVFVDATGVGAGVAPRLTRLKFSKAASVMVASSPTYDTEMGKFFQLRDQLWWSTREWLRTDTGAMLPPDDELLQELRTPLYSVAEKEIRVTKKDIMKEMLGRSPDRAESLILTFAPNKRRVGAW